MSVGASMRAALWETYHYSLRLLALNTVLSLVVVGTVLAVPTLPLGLLAAAVVAGPVTAALVHCAVLLAAGEEITLADAVEGGRRHWRRGLALGALFGGGLMLGAVALTFYGSEPHRAWPLAALVVYLLACYCLLILVAWPLAIAQPERTIGDVVADAGRSLLRRPGRSLAFGSALLAVNIAGAVTVMPLLTLTIAYTFLAAAHAVLPTREETA
jgi:hypothetical protein